MVLRVMCNLRVRAARNTGILRCTWKCGNIAELLIYPGAGIPEQA